MTVQIIEGLIPLQLCQNLIDRCEKVLQSDHMIVMEKTAADDKKKDELLAQQNRRDVKFSDLEENSVRLDYGDNYSEKEYVNMVRPNYEEYQGYFEPIELTDQELEDKLKISEVAWIDAAIGHCLALVSKEMSDFYGVKIEPGQGGLVKMKPGAVNGLHYDQRNPFTEEARKTLPEELKPKVFEYSFLIYLNQQGKDYDGGELVFYQHDLSIKPTPGMAVFFIGDPDHMHEVTEVKSGNRYSLLGFASENGRPLVLD